MQQRPDGLNPESSVLAEIDPHDRVYPAFGETLTGEVQRYYRANKERRSFREAYSVDR